MAQGIFEKTFDDLMSIEVNTIESEGMTARKMPIWPHALLDLAQKYADYMSEKMRIDLVQFASEYAAQDQAAPATERQAVAVMTKLRPQTPPMPTGTSRSGEAAGKRQVVPDREPSSITPAARVVQSTEEAALRRDLEPPSGDGKPPRLVLTNGAETFDVLRWAAESLLGDGGRPRIPGQDRAVLLRIQRTGDQIESMARRLRSDGKFRPWLDCTRAELEDRNQFEPPSLPPDYQTLLRKAWDIGTERVVLQTVVQIDGDVVFRTALDLTNARNAATLAAHQRGAEVAVSHWYKLLDFVRAMVGVAAAGITGGK